MHEGDSLDIEDFGIIGNQETCALIGRNGSVGWLCVPYLDSKSIFASILDPVRGGYLSVEPTLKYHSIQNYIQDTNVLITTFSSPTGEAAVTDFMPPLELGGDHRMLLRKIQGRRRDCTLRVGFRPRFDYGRSAPRLRREGGRIVAFDADHCISIAPPNHFMESQTEASAIYPMSEGDCTWIVLMWGEDPKPPDEAECEMLLQKTVDFWSGWSSRHRRSESVHIELCNDLAMRSGLALKLLLDPGTGGIAAAATASLPESIGGGRNWDYRFAWIRDASFTAQALYHLGYDAEATAYREWVMEILRRIDDLSEVKPLYPLHRESYTEEGKLEVVVEALAGYRSSGPVRIGNLAARQTQLDIYGELVNTVFETLRYGEDIDQKVWATVKRICDFVAGSWRRKDRGIWEMRADPRDYVHSKLMCWVALDRGIRIARRHDLDAPLETWGSSAEEIRAAIIEKGFSRRLDTFVQAFDNEELDAAALLIPIHGLLPPEDPRVQSTIDVVWKGLSMGNGLLRRYRCDDGLAGEEGAFVLCSFWLVNALAVSRRIDEAELVFRQMLEHASPLGLYSEEIDPRNGNLIGNFPQAISHIGLINAALHLGIAKGRAHRTPPPQSEGGW
jgi:alpha,alpha-trehalase